MGLVGLGVGIVTAVTGVGALGLVAGIAAVAAPVVPRRGLGSRLQHDVSASAAAVPAAPAIAAPPAPMPEPPDLQSALDPFHSDTDLLAPHYFGIAVENRLKAARRFLKPLAVVQLHIDGESPAQTRFGGIVLETLRDCDTACALAGDRIALVLEDTPENGAIWAVERIRRAIAEVDESVNMWAGIACYPAHGLDAPEVITQCEDALQRAREWPRDRIEIALSD